MMNHRANPSLLLLVCSTCGKKCLGKLGIAQHIRHMLNHRGETHVQ